LFVIPDARERSDPESIFKPFNIKMDSGLRQNDGLGFRHSGRAPAQVIRNPFSTRFNVKVDSGLRRR
jgi:hypothetical protein